MKKKAERQYERFPGSFDIEAIRNATTIGEFDDAYIAKIYGFQDKFDYYAKCGSKQYLKKIHVPTIAINARDDPFIESSSLPTEADVHEAPVRLIFHEYGGHCGFDTSAAPRHGWLAEELISALQHFALELQKHNETIDVVI